MTIRPPHIDIISQGASASEGLLFSSAFGSWILADRGPPSAVWWVRNGSRYLDHETGTWYAMTSGGWVSENDPFATLIPDFQAALYAGGVNDERYRWYIPTLPHASGTNPADDFAALYAGGRRVVRNFMEPFDTNNDPELAKAVAQITTGDTLAPDEISIGDMGVNWGSAVIGMPVCLKWAGAATLNVGGITVTRQGVYNISSVNGTFVRLRIPGQTRTTPGSSTQVLTAGAVLAQEFRAFNSRITNWRTSIQRAIDAGLWVVVSLWGGNLWDRATTQAGLAPFNDFGWPAIDALHRSWCEWVTSSINDPQNHTVIDLQNESIALGFPNYATMETADKPHRERLVLITREAAPSKIILAGGAYYAFPLSLAEIVPQDVPGLVYKVQVYSDAAPATAMAPVTSWLAANPGRYVCIAEADKLTYAAANGTERRDWLRAFRDWCRENLGVSAIFWGRRYPVYDNDSGTRELGTDLSSVFTAYANMREFLDERPINTVAPAISGSAQEGQTLTATLGTWTGLGPITYAYQWQRGTIPIMGATGSTYTVQAADIGQTLRVIVTGVNSLGSGVGTSADTPVVTGIAPPAAVTGLVIQAVGPSHLSHATSNVGSTAENGFARHDALPAPLAAKVAREVFDEEMQVYLPGIPITWDVDIQAGIGITGWATGPNTITAACQTAITSWIANATANPTRKAVFLIYHTHQELQVTDPAVSTDQWDERHLAVVNAALSQFDAALPAHGNREVWVAIPGNRFNTDASSRSKIVRLLNRTGMQLDPAYPAIPGFYFSSQRGLSVLAETNGGGDGIHYGRGQHQRAMAELAWAMLRRWNVAGVPASPMPVAVWRSGAQQVSVRVQLGRGSAGELVVATGTLNVGTWGLLDGGTFRNPTVGAPITTFQAQGFIDIPLDFTVPVDGADVLHFATSLYLTTMPAGQDTISLPYETTIAGPRITNTWDSIVAPRPIIRTLQPFTAPVSLIAPSDPTGSEPATILTEADEPLLTEADEPITVEA